MADPTDSVDALRTGDSKKTEELLTLLYEELRAMAARKLAQENPNQTLQPTALVHEVWLKLNREHQQQWQSRAHFFGAAGEAMRRILIDKARRKSSQKRGENAEHDELHSSRIELAAPSDEIVAVNDALDELAREDELSANVVKLRYFVGLSIPEIAEALELAPRTVDRHWSFARAWLKRKLSG